MLQKNLPPDIIRQSRRPRTYWSSQLMRECRGMDRFIDYAAVTVIAMLCLQAVSLCLAVPRPL